jgi:hypothetical protein
MKAKKFLAISFLSLQAVLFIYAFVATRMQPYDDQLPGVYKLGDYSRDFVIDKGYLNANGSLSLNPDGSAVFTDFPDILREGGQSHGKLVSATGKWSVEDDSNQHILFKLTWKDHRNDNNETGDIFNGSSGLEIGFPFGDPDEAEGLVLEKTTREYKK